jgi:branched-chain amino acid transport system substrate-binding protein
LLLGGHDLPAAAKAGKLGVNGAPTTTELVTGLHDLSNESLGGMAPPLRFPKNRQHPVNRWFYLRVQGGEFTTPDGLQPACRAPVA